MFPDVCSQCRCCTGSAKRVVPYVLAASNEPSLLEIVIGLDDFTQLVLGPLVAAVSIGVVLLHELLEAGLDLRAIYTLVQAQRFEGLALQRPQPARGLGSNPARTACKKGMRILEGVVQPVIAPLPRPRRAGLPGRPMADDGILLERLHLGVAPAIEVVVGGVELPHVIKAEQVVLAFPAAAHRGAVETGIAAALPLADRASGGRCHLARRLGTHRVEMF